MVSEQAPHPVGNEAVPADHPVGPVGFTAVPVDVPASFDSPPNVEVDGDQSCNMVEAEAVL